MCPAVLETDSPVQYHNHHNMEEGYFPPISRKSAISMSTSEPDPNEYYKPERSSHTRGSMPASLSASPVKFPTIDRSNSTSVASLPGSRAARQRSQSRDLRSSYCRSPSCPSNLDVSRDFNHLDFAIFNRQVQKDRNLCDMEKDESTKEDRTKLPNIFSKELSAQSDLSNNVLYRNKPRDAANTLSLRRSESFKNALNGASESRPYREAEQLSPRQNQTAALLLPIRNDSKLNGGRKKKKNRRRARDEDVDTSELTQKSLGTFNEDALDAIARENRHNNEDGISSPRAIDINPSSRKVKQWMNDNRAAQNGEIKA